MFWTCCCMLSLFSSKGKKNWAGHLTGLICSSNQIHSTGIVKRKQQYPGASLFLRGKSVWVQKRTNKLCQLRQQARNLKKSLMYWLKIFQHTWKLKYEGFDASYHSSNTGISNRCSVCSSNGKWPRSVPTSPGKQNWCFVRREGSAAQPFWHKQIFMEKKKDLKEDFFFVFYY